MYSSRTNIILQRALKKHGLEAFEFIVVEFVKDTSLLTTREQVHLDWLFSLSFELRYNICATASSMLGYTHTAETKAAISAANTGRTLTAEAKAAIGAASAARNSGENHPMFGKTHTAEAKAAISAALAGENNPMFGNTHTAETKAAISAALSGRTLSAPLRGPPLVLLS